MSDEQGGRDRNRVAGAPRAWWQRGVIYQVYPRSFSDSNSDGVGDLAGIRARLDYLGWLGVDAIWLSPIFPSPMADFGYDIADYQGVEPLFGTLDDFDALIADMHRRGLRLLLDLVPNHTSDRHPWFAESRSSRAAPKRDWYIWQDARRDGSPPNDWIAMFGGSAWTWDESTGQYYFHSFLEQQPDLNWTNPEVRAAIRDVVRFWFRRGVDGFRVDVVNLLAKAHELERLPEGVAIDAALAADPAHVAAALGRQRWADSGRIFDYVVELRAVADEFDERVLIGEAWLPVSELVRLYGDDRHALHMPFNFQLITLPWDAPTIRRAVIDYEAALPPGAWPNWVVGNHDKSRIASRVGSAQARVAALLLLTLRGTPTLYYGDELGMTDFAIPSAAQRDPQGLRGGESRDPERTPMRWDARPNAGFSAARPWLPMGAELGRINVDAERRDADSMLALYRRLLDLRSREVALSEGEWHDLGMAGTALAYLRSAGQRRLLVAANLANAPSALPEQAAAMSGRVLASTVESIAEDGRLRFAGRTELAPAEAVLVLLD